MDIRADAYVTQAVLPVATSARREGNLRIDGNLDDWSGDDLIHDGQLTKMMDRPSIQHWRIEPSSADVAAFTPGWSDDDFYVAFRVGGVSPRQAFTRISWTTNFAGRGVKICARYWCSRFTMTIRSGR